MMESRKIRIIVLTIGVMLLLPPLVHHRITDWYLDRKIEGTQDGAEIVALVNVTLDRNPEYWNGRYAKYFLQAQGALETEYLAKLLIHRHGTNAISEVLNGLPIGADLDKGRMMILEEALGAAQDEFKN